MMKADEDELANLAVEVLDTVLGKTRIVLCVDVRFPVLVSISADQKLSHWIIHELCHLKRLSSPIVLGSIIIHPPHPRLCHGALWVLLSATVRTSRTAPTKAIPLGYL